MTAEKEQRGVSNTKGEDSNCQPNANKEFTRRYFDVGPTDFIHALGFEYFRRATTSKASSTAR
eukprot:5603251-Alexandrium_andersonii.AAC.1